MLIELLVNDFNFTRITARDRYFPVVLKTTYIIDNYTLQH